MCQKDTAEEWKRREARLLRELWGPANTGTHGGTYTRPKAGICLAWEVGQQGAGVLRAELGSKKVLSKE